MKYCNIDGCNQYRKENGIKNTNYFTVTEQREPVWKEVLKPHGTILSVRDRVCNIHFKEGEVYRSQTIGGNVIEYDKWQLQRDAIPTLFLKLPPTTFNSNQKRERPQEIDLDSIENLLDKRQKIDDSGSSVGQLSDLNNQIMDGSIVIGIQDQLTAVKMEFQNRTTELNKRIQDLESQLLSYQQNNTQEMSSESKATDSPKLLNIAQPEQNEVAETMVVHDGANAVEEIPIDAQNVKETIVDKKPTNHEKRKRGRPRKIAQELVDVSAESNMELHRVLRTSTSGTSVENENDWQKIINSEYSYKNWKSFVDSTKTSITFYEPVFVDGNMKIIKQVTVARHQVERKLFGETFGNSNTWKELGDVETILKEFDEIDEQKC